MMTKLRIKSRKRFAAFAWLLSLAAFALLAAAAYSARGYIALGGEAVALLPPLMMSSPKRKGRSSR